MYEQFFGFSGMPFSLLPDADFLYLSPRHRRAANLLEYGLFTQAGFTLITGDVGAGKTTIVRRMIKNAGNDKVIGLITNPSASLGRLLEWVYLAFDIKDKHQNDAERYHAFVDYLLKTYASGKRAILIIDEAQNLTAEQLEELRMLSNVNNEKDQLLQIVIVGQPELLERMKRPELRQLLQRISVHCHLDALSPPETRAYIHHRLQLVGGFIDLFDDRVCAAVHFFTGGVPRLINLLCDQTLVYAFSEEQRTLTPELVAEVVRDRAKMGLSAFRALPETWHPASLPYDIAEALTAIRA